MSAAHTRGGGGGGGRVKLLEFDAETGDPNKEKHFSEAAATKWPVRADRPRAVATQHAQQNLLNLPLVHTLAGQKQCHQQFSGQIYQ